MRKVGKVLNLNFLSRLCGGEVERNKRLSSSEFLSRLCGGEG